MPPGPPTSFADQVSLLQQRRLSIPDFAEAERFLSNVNYYRFRGYLDPFLDQSTNSNPRPFQAGTTLEAVVERNIFDTQLPLRCCSRRSTTSKCHYAPNGLITWPIAKEKESIRI